MVNGLFIIVDKARARGEDVKGVGVVTDKELKRGDIEPRAKAGGWRSLTHTRCSGGRGQLRRGKWRGDERGVSSEWEGEFVRVKR